MRLLPIILFACNAIGCLADDPIIDATETPSEMRDRLTTDVNVVNVEAQPTPDTAFSTVVASSPDSDEPSGGEPCGWSEGCVPLGDDVDPDDPADGQVACDEWSCAGHGACTVVSNQITCACDEGFIGERCEDEPIVDDGGDGPSEDTGSDPVPMDGCIGGPDADLDGVPDACDVCADGDDTLDSDGDGIPDDCDTCWGGDNAADADADGTPDACDICPDGDDSLDADGDTVPDACDVCPGGNDTADGCEPGSPAFGED